MVARYMEGTIERVKLNVRDKPMSLGEGSIEEARIKGDSSMIEQNIVPRYQLNKRTWRLD